MFPRSIGLALLLTAYASADTFVVLPFANISKNAPANINWVGESIAETLRETLAAGEAIALDRDEREEAYKQLGIKQNVLLTRASMIKIAGALDADQIVYGEFELTPLPPSTVAAPSQQPLTAVRGSLRISAHVLDLKRMHQGPEFSEQGALEDLASLQMRLAWRTLQFVRGSRAPAEADFHAAHPPVRLDAMESYIRGLLATSKDQKLRFLSQAVRIDPGFSPPTFRLGMLYYDQQEFRPAAEWFAKVKHTDAHYRESVFLLGVSRFRSATMSRRRRASNNWRGICRLRASSITSARARPAATYPTRWPRLIARLKSIRAILRRTSMPHWCCGNNRSSIKPVRICERYSTVMRAMSRPNNCSSGARRKTARGRGNMWSFKSG